MLERPKNKRQQAIQALHLNHASHQSIKTRQERKGKQSWKASKKAEEEKKKNNKKKRTKRKRVEVCLHRMHYHASANPVNKHLPCLHEHHMSHRPPIGSSADAKEQQLLLAPPSHQIPSPFLSILWQLRPRFRTLLCPSACLFYPKRGTLDTAHSCAVSVGNIRFYKMQCILGTAENEC